MFFNYPKSIAKRTSELTLDDFSSNKKSRSLYFHIKTAKIGLSFLSQVATYHPVSSIWPFFFSQVATYHPVADYNIKKKMLYKTV